MLLEWEMTSKTPFASTTKLPVKPMVSHAREHTNSVAIGQGSKLEVALPVNSEPRCDPAERLQRVTMRGAAGVDEGAMSEFGVKIESRRVVKYKYVTQIHCESMGGVYVQ